MATVLDGNGMASPAVVSGSYAGTTAALTVTIGFAPSWIQAINITDGDTMWFWSTQDQANVYVTTTAMAASVAAVTTTATGFSLPASNSVINENGKTYVFIAGR